MNQFVKISDDGAHADITLSREFMISGVKTTALRMREPLVGDQLAAETTASGGAMEVLLFANLCGCSVEEMRALPMKSYARVQAAYKLFTD